MLYFIVLTTLLSIRNCHGLQLISVQSIFRHGDRAPSSPYPKDPVTMHNWPNGWAQLTPIGALQAQELGSYYRRRYSERLQLMRDDRHEVSIRSTSKTRAIESAQNVLHGLFGRRTKLPEVQVIGEYKSDLLLKPNSVSCRKYDNLLRTDNQMLFSKYNSLYREFFSHLSNLTGYDISMSTIDKVYDAVYREVIHGVSQDKWLYDYVMNRESGDLITYLDLILELKRVQRLGEFNSLEKARLRTGFLLGHIVGQFENVINDKLLPKLTLYSSHDATLTSLLYSLNTSNELLVPYAAAISFELYVDGLHMPSYYVKTLYRNETGSDREYELKIEGCEKAACELSHFRNVLQGAIFRRIEEQQRECEKE